MGGFRMGRKREVIFLLLLFLLPLLCSCSLDDDRDLCCNRARMTYRLTYDNIDYFSERIDSLRCYLFSIDSTGRSHYMGRMYVDEEKPNQVDLGMLDEGEYGMIAIGDLDDYGTLDSISLGAEFLHFRADDFFRETKALDNGDPIYWGAERFVIEKNGDNDFVTELSNIHCHLRVKVEWQGLPPYEDNYYLQLSGVWDGYYMYPEDAEEKGGKLYPEYSGGVRSVVCGEPLRQQALFAEFVTLRYSDDYIPSIKLWNGKTELTRAIDLKPVFREWGWYPDKTAIQEYEISLFIYRDGSVVIRPYLDVGINDWIDGGDFS